MSENNQIFLIGLLIFLFFIRCNNHNYTTKKNENISKTEKVYEENKEIAFVPDTTINKKLILRDEVSIQSLVGNRKIILTEEKEKFPAAYLMNSNLSEYLTVYTYYGDLENQFSAFEVGYTTEKKVKNPILTKEPHFFTENGIKLGMLSDSLLHDKGDDYKILISNTGDTTISYKLTDYKNSPFLKRFQMPSYYLECKIKNSKVHQFKFGFDYP